jgi:hypothetical protein
MEMSERRYSAPRGRPTAYSMIVLIFGIQACAGEGRTTEPPQIVPSEEVTVMPHVRRVEPQRQDSEVVLRFGERLEVTPPARAGGWQVIAYPAGILRRGGDQTAARRHTFDAVAIGHGDVSLLPARSSSAVDAFTIRITVMRDNVQPPSP